MVAGLTIPASLVTLHVSHPLLQSKGKRGE